MQEHHAERSVIERSSPAGRPIRVRTTRQVPPEWVARRRKAYRLIDRMADGAKHVVRRWLLPRPASAHRRIGQI
jgi:hypothetical protein